MGKFISKNPWSIEEDNKLRELCAIGNYKYKELAVIFSRTKDQVKERCYKLKCPTKFRNKPIFQYDRHFFDKITYLSSYWAAFFSADACLHYVNERVTLTLTLAGKDENHIQRLS